MASLTGFDPEVVNTSINSVKNAYNSLSKALGDDMQNDFIGGMSDKWACNDAQKFFNDAFKPAIDGLIKSSNTIFESVVNSMNTAAQRWAADTESTYTPVTFSPIEKTMDTSVILENIGGVRGIDLENTDSVLAKLPMIAEAAKTALEEAKQAVQSCGFLDYASSQSENLSSSLETIKNNIDSAVQSMTNDSKNAINNTLERYGNTKGKVAEAFAGN